MSGIIKLLSTKDQKRCDKCKRFLGKDYAIITKWFGLRKKYHCWPGCLPGPEAEPYTAILHGSAALTKK